MIAKHTEEVNAMKNAHDQIKNTLDNEILILKKKLESVESELNYSKQENGHMKESLNLGTLQKQEIETLQKTNEGLQKNIEDLEEKLRNDEVIRKQLHNTIQELKGNIRVFCRVRPLLPSEQEDISQSLYQVTIPEGTENRIDLIQTLENATGDKKLSKTFDFNFDKVFEPKSTQEQVFSEISQLVQSALDGYNVCIFAYGQTGTGKTFTMEGPSGNADESQAGMIPRAVSQIFNAAESLTEKGWKYELQAQYLEIYNEELRDLLSDSSDSPKKLDIKHHLNRTTVTDIVLKSVKSPKEVYKLLEQASSNRAVASTNCNERSSRSHSVFTLKLSGTNSITEESVSSVLNLIDLAGSERLSSSGSTGERLKETQAINKSLSSLGDVIVALAGKQSHIPYRNSKLTYLLQHSLGGNSKTLMFVNVSPVPASFNETLCSLRFAKKVNACEIGTARKQANVKPTELLKS
ncbi:P-loop containing nucleoside triphosphate hydrolase protein [Globomyces pollinis-pini]|nr:P-loop containing nucleoside triphosphate hydrolase protein [Globomyces pollinis-pini]